MSVDSKQFYSLGSTTSPETQGAASVVADAVSWLLNQQNEDGTWAGPDNLDRLVSTNHALQTLLCCGFSASDPCMKPGLEYLAGIDKETNLSFFWRAGVFLNLPGFESLVAEDIRYIWTFRNRIGVHKDYPIPFFLLKLLRLNHLTLEISVDARDVLGWVLEEWTEAHCWYERVSITSMAAALLHDMRFRNKSRILTRSVEFLLSRYCDCPGGGMFVENLVEDAFVVFNLCERNCLIHPQFKPLQYKVGQAVRRILAANKDGIWESKPPFGGAVSSRIYPTAVLTRALMAFFSTEYGGFPTQVGAALVSRARPAVKKSLGSLKPFWGEVKPKDDTDPFCFVLMPFSPDSLTQVYERYVKCPIETHLKLKCIRADDIYTSTEIIRDIWSCINRSQIIVAELTDKNPNVFYELGLAHVLGKKVILIAQSVDFVPFDLRSIRTIIYKNELKGYEDLARKIVEFVKTDLNFTV